MLPHVTLVPANETSSTDLSQYCRGFGERARRAARELALSQTVAKDDWLGRLANALIGRGDEILEANARDLQEARTRGQSGPQLDRLSLNPARLRAMAEALREVAALPDPVGQVRETRIRPNGLQVQKVGVPLGVLLFVYESRPNVTIDAAGLAVKSGNAIILRGGSDAALSNRALGAIARSCLEEGGLPPDAIQVVDTPDRAAVGELLRLREFVDLVIPRGGEELIRRVAREACMPVLKHYQGNCHVYVDRAADPEMALSILINAKCQRPGVCNAAESLLVHRDIAREFLPKAGERLRAQGVEVRGCRETQEWIPGVRPATDADYAAEYLDLVISVRVVAGLEEAIEHINRFGSGHTDAIVTNDLRAARRFAAAVDSSAVMVNASTRFNDGHELGLGAEIGISTDKFHARGPCGLLELTSYKYVVHGDGHLRGE